ncbi:MAG: 3-isopropylmalate dehydratase large subunit, partial [Clostridia bacterium]|nr:3-isopropylmalate dehydratase large subunit [Clostridia bacterium]
NKDIKSAQMAKRMRDFARGHDILHYYEVGRAGIEHALLPEQGLAAPGELIIGADSHTCTYGALGALSTGVGSTDMAGGMALGKAWFKVPEAIRVTLKGVLQPPVSGKDVILHLIGLIGVDGARYMSLEFAGDGVGAISMDGRLTIANMAIEAGAKNGIFPVDAITRAYLNENGRVTRAWTAYEPDPDAVYAQEVTIDLGTVPLTVSLPHLPSNTKPAGECGDIRVDQVVIGSCTNGRMEDLRVAAGILRGKQVAPTVRCIVIPGTQAILRQAIDEGLAQAMIDAGALVTMPTCGPCLGGHCGVLAAGERCVATTNRNFVGRMGDPASEVILAGPAVAAASALTGYISVPE